MTASAGGGRAILFAGAVSLVALATAPAAAVAAWARLALGLLIVAATAAGSARKPVPRRPWWLLTGALALWVAGDALFDAHEAAWPAEVPTRAADGLWIAGYPLFAAALYTMVRRRSGREALAGLLDGVLLGAALVIVVWVTLVAPTSGELGVTDRILNAVYVLSDGVLVAAAAWLVLTPGPASVAGRLLLTGAATVFLADVAWSIADRVGHDWAAVLNPAYVVGYALVAAAVLHPSAAALTRAVAVPGDHLQPARLAFLAASLFIGPLAVLLPARQPLFDKLVVSGCSLAIMVAVVGRFVALVRRTERQQERLAAEELRFRTMAESVPVGIYEVGADLRITWSNTRAEELFGRRIDGLRAPELLGAVPAEDRRRIIEASERVLAGKAASTELRIRRADGTQRWVRWRGVPAPRSGTDHPTTPVVFASTEDVTDLKTLQDELARLATHDPVTGLPNRRLLFEELTAALATLADRRRSLAVMFCDLDRFKLVNDMLGHDAGDALLREIAGRLRTMLRTDDVVARFGGDEFVLVLRDPGSKLDVAALAQRIVERVQEPVIIGDHPVSVGASIGIALAHGPDDDPDALLRDADVAMYRAKSSGRGRYVFFGSGVHPAEG